MALLHKAFEEPFEAVPAKVIDLSEYRLQKWYSNQKRSS